MSLLALTRDEQRHWTLAGSVALLVHVSVAALMLAWVRPAEPPIPEPVVLVDLPPEAAPETTVASPQPVTQPRPEYKAPQPVAPPVKIAPVRAPLPIDPVTLPPPAPSEPQTPPPAPEPSPMVAPSAPVSPVAASNTEPNAGSGAVPGNDPRARKREADYFALISAHLNRRKTYPVEARQARQQGVVVVRFTVDRNGGVSNVAIKRSSGHDLLDQATLALLAKVAPLPSMPASMQRDSVTLSLPIDYSLKTN